MLTSCNSLGLHLLLPIGTTTWQRGRSLTTIDLVLGTAGIRQRALQCQAHPEWAQLPDHIPIETVLDMQVVDVAPQQGFNIRKLDHQAFCAQLARTLAELEWRGKWGSRDQVEAALGEVKTRLVTSL